MRRQNSTGADPMNTAQLAARMQKAAEQLPTSRLIETVRHVGGAVLPPAENMARGALLTAYAAREGSNAMVALMDEIGL
jgi:hypothetical protein